MASSDRHTLHQLFSRHRGQMRQLAEELRVHPASLANWFSRGDSSKRIESAVYARAEELLELEKRDVSLHAHRAGILTRIQAGA